MSRQGRERAAKAATVLTGVAVLISTVLLVADVAVARWRATADVERIEALAERVKSDAEVAAELEEEKKQQTETTLTREAAQRSLAWVLLVAMTGFVTGSKWLLARQSPHHSSSKKGAEKGSPAGRDPAEPSKSPIPDGPFSRGSESEAGKVLVQLGGTNGGSSEPAEPEVDLALVDDLIVRHGRGREAAIPILQAIQEHYRYLPDVALRRLCELTEITPAWVAGTSTFYSRFRHSPVGEHLVRVCHGTACHVAGAGHVDQELRRQLAIPSGADTDLERRFTLEPVACVGCCSLAPVMMIGDETAGHLTPATASDRLAEMTMAAMEDGA